MSDSELSQSGDEPVQEFALSEAEKDDILKDIPSLVVTQDDDGNFSFPCAPSSSFSDTSLPQDPTPAPEKYIYISGTESESEQQTLLAKNFETLLTRDLGDRLFKFWNANKKDLRPLEMNQAINSLKSKKPTRKEAEWIIYFEGMIKERTSYSIDLLSRFEIKMTEITDFVVKILHDTDLRLQERDSQIATLKQTVDRNTESLDKVEKLLLSLNSDKLPSSSLPLKSSSAIQKPSFQSGNLIEFIPGQGVLMTLTGEKVVQGLVSLNSSQKAFLISAAMMIHKANIPFKTGVTSEQLLGQIVDYCLATRLPGQKVIQLLLQGKLP